MSVQSKLSLVHLNSNQEPWVIRLKTEGQADEVLESWTSRAIKIPMKMQPRFWIEDWCNKKMKKKRISKIQHRNKWLSKTPSRTEILQISTISLPNQRKCCLITILIPSLLQLHKEMNWIRHQWFRRQRRWHRRREQAIWYKSSKMHIQRASSHRLMSAILNRIPKCSRI